MSEGNIKLLKNPGLTVELDVEDRTTSLTTVTIKPGEPVSRDAGSATANSVRVVQTASPTIGSDLFCGLAMEESNETSSADGVVLVNLPVPNFTVLRGTATTSTNVNTAAKLLGLMLDWVKFDNAGTQKTPAAITIDENEGDDPNTCSLCIVNGDYTEYYLDVIVHAAACTAGPLVGQTMD